VHFWLLLFRWLGPLSHPSEKGQNLKKEEKEEVYPLYSPMVGRNVRNVSLSALQGPEPPFNTFERYPRL